MSTATNLYDILYRSDGEWIRGCIKDTSIYSALDWVHANIQRSGVCVTLVPPPVEEVPAFNRDKNWMKQFHQAQHYPR